MSSIDQQVRGIIAQQLGVDLSKVIDEANFVNDLNADSLDLVELIMELEETFDVEVPESTMEKLQTVGEVIAYINDLKK